jgi:ketosteroid isomerase-like protein
MAEDSSAAGQLQAALIAIGLSVSNYIMKGERTMTRIKVSRRNLLATGVGALAVGMGLPPAADAVTSESHNSMNEEIIRKWYTAWVKKDFDTFNNLQADNFTFSSAAGDDHISKSTFKTQCWDTQAPLISSCDLERISTGTDDAFVKYVGHTTNGKSFRNVEYFRIKNGKFESLECYFGAPSNFPSAVSTRQK